MPMDTSYSQSGDVNNKIDLKVVEKMKEDVERLLMEAQSGFTKYGWTPYNFRRSVSGGLASVTYWKQQGPKDDEHPDYYMELVLNNGAKAVRHYDGTTNGPREDLLKWFQGLCDLSTADEMNNLSGDELYLTMKPSVLKWLSRATSKVCQECRAFANMYDGGYTRCDLQRPCYAKDAKAFLEKFPED